jgi:hypothetical protein
MSVLELRHSLRFPLALTVAFGVLGACTDAPSAPAAPEIAGPRRTLVCFGASEDGGAPVIFAYDPAVGCPDGFDVRIWY